MGKLIAMFWENYFSFGIIILVLGKLFQFGKIAIFWKKLFLLWDNYFSFGKISLVLGKLIAIFWEKNLLWENSNFVWDKQNLVWGNGTSGTP